MNKLTLLPGEEIRCELIRLYPDAEQHALIRQMQEEVMNVTNHIIRSRKDVKNARIAYALRNGLIGPAPVFPEQPALPKPETDEAKAEVKAAWAAYRKAENAAGKEYAAWMDAVMKICDGIPSLAWRDDSEQILRSIYSRGSAARVFREVRTRVVNTKLARPKRRLEDCPIVFRDKACVTTGSFYGDRRGSPFYNALVKAPGIPPIPGRLRRPLPGKQVQGVTLTRKADGWYAAVKCIVPKRQLPEPAFSPIGVDVGQVDLVALSDGYKEANPRDAEFAAIKAALQEKGDRSDDANTQQQCRNQVARLDQSRKRRVVHWINSELLPKLEKHAIVFVEKLAKGFKSDRGPLSCMHMILSAVKQRLGDLDAKGKLGPKSRVVEVPCACTSQECAQCGNIDKSARKGKIYTCTSEACRVVLDADMNAARNILRRGMEMLRTA